MRGEVVDARQDALRTVLANWLVQRKACLPADAVLHHGLDNVLTACEQEGIVSLAHARLQELAASQPVPHELTQAIAARARLCAGRSLLCVSETRRIQQVLAEAGIPAIWLKGIAVAQWLYPRSHLRDIADIDLLVPDHATLLHAAEVLAPLGYALPNAHIAGDLVVHELLAFSERVRLELDLHWDLSNGAMFAGRLPWSVLAAEAALIPGLGKAARGLSPRHAFLHACMHLAAARLVWPEDRLRWLYDIHLLALQFDAEDWARVLAAAREAQLADPCAYALRACARTFGTQVEDAVLVALDAAARSERVCTARLHRWGYVQWASWRRLPDLATRLRWLRQLLFPDMAHLRERYGADSASPLRISARRAMDGCRRWWGYASRALR